MRLLTPCLALALLLGACTHTELSERDQLHAQLRWTNQTRQLKTSLFAAPFFRDDSRRLLTVQPPDETELLVTPQGRLISPGAAEEVIPAGTKVTVLAVSFPTGWESFARPLMTPREVPWVELAVEGRGAKPAFVLVLRPDVKTPEEVDSELAKWLTTDDVAGEVGKLPELDRVVVLGKRFSKGASARALELAWGTPVLRRIWGEGASVAEEWTWRSDTQKRTARLVDGIVTTIELPDAPGEESASNAGR